MQSKQDELDFDSVRDAMYKYSKKAQRRFFKVPALAFFFAWFAQREEVAQMVEDRYIDKNQTYRNKLIAEINSLRKDAIKSMHENEFYQAVESL